MEPQTNRLTTLTTGFFLTKRAEGCSPKTVHDYQASLRHLDRWLVDHRIEDPTTLTTTQIKDFLVSMHSLQNRYGQPLSAKTVYNAWVALRSFYRWLEEESGLASPVAKIGAPKKVVPV